MSTSGPLGPLVYTIVCISLNIGLSDKILFSFQSVNKSIQEAGPAVFSTISGTDPYSSDSTEGGSSDAGVYTIRVNKMSHTGLDKQRILILIAFARTKRLR